MQLSKLVTLCLILSAFTHGGCMAQQIDSNADTAWHERCRATNGWKFCFRVPAPGTGSHVDGNFKLVQKYDGTHMQLTPWKSWTGKHWDVLVADVFPAPTLPPSATDDQLLAWAHLWDEAQRKRDISAGQNPAGIPRAFKTDVFVDALGRRWARGVRKSRELNLPYTRVEKKFITSIGQSGFRLEISFECSEPHPNCRLIDQMVSGARWEKE